MDTIKAALIAFAIGAVLGAGSAGYVAWQQLRDARADVEEARGNLDRAIDGQREAEESARRLADELAGAKTALRDSRETVSRLQERVEQFGQLIADSGEQVDALEGSLGTAREAARREQELITELGKLIGRLGADDSTAAP